LAPLTPNWPVKALEAPTVVVPLVGLDCVRAPPVTLRLKLHPPLSDDVSESVPLTEYVAIGSKPVVVIAPVVGFTTRPSAELVVA
jgi:hypothetical protein